jgi:hypothetical protein
MLSAAVLVPLPVASALNPLFPTLTISPMNPGAQDVVVTPTSVGSASYTAVVTVDKPPWGTVEVNLDCTASPGWPCIVEPDQIVYTTSGDAQVVVNVVVPQAAPAGAAIVHLTGVATYIGGAKTAEASGTLNVVQYYRFEVVSDKPSSSDNPAEVSISITNLGNGPDSFKIGIENLDKLKDNGFEISLSKPATGEVPINHSENITIKVEYGDKAPAGKVQSIRLLITSVGSENMGEAVTKSYVISVKVSKGGFAESAEEAVEDISSFLKDYGGALIALIIILTIIALVVRWRGRKKRRLMEEEMMAREAEGLEMPPDPGT